MKFVSFRVNETPRYGVVDGENITDLTDRLGYRDLHSLIAADASAEAAKVSRAAGADYSTGEIRFLPVIPNPGKIICVGLNYHEHREETGMTQGKFPAIFPRWADTQIGHREDVVLPKNTQELDWEGELALIIGRGGRHIEAADAMSHVFGYACYNDVSLRDFQRHASQFTPGKNFPATGAFGPYLVTADEMGELKGKRIQTRLNGEIMQDATLDMMIFPPSWLIAYLSSFTPLSPGDVIVSGTPGGVGWTRNPPHWMRAGDEVEVEIDGCGILKNAIVAEEHAISS